jgi:hypothetical protein
MRVVYNILDVDAAVFTTMALLIKRDLLSSAGKSKRARTDTDMLLSLGFKVLFFKRHLSHGRATDTSHIKHIANLLITASPPVPQQ